MKRLVFCLCLAVVLVSALAACGGDSAKVEEFVNACVENGGPEVTEEKCRCAAKSLEENLNSEQFQVIVDFMVLAGQAEEDPEKAAELMSRMATMDEDAIKALEEAGRSCE